MSFWRKRGATLSLALALVACRQKERALDGPQTTSARPSSAAAGDEGHARVRGLDAQSSDPLVVKLIRDVVAQCPWNGRFEGLCRRVEHDELVTDGKADETLVNMLEDESEKVRWLGARLLLVNGKKYGRDPNLAKRVVAAAKAETSDSVVQPMASAAAAISGTATGPSEELKWLMTEHAVEKMRSEVAVSLLGQNPHLFDSSSRRARSTRPTASALPSSFRSAAKRRPTRAKPRASSGATG